MPSFPGKVGICAYRVRRLSGVGRSSSTIRTADMSGVGAREVELGQFVIGLSSASVVPLVSLREQFRNVG